MQSSTLTCCIKNFSSPPPPPHFKRKCKFRLATDQLSMNIPTVTQYLWQRVASYRTMFKMNKTQLY